MKVLQHCSWTRWAVLITLAVGCGARESTTEFPDAIAPTASRAFAEVRDARSIFAVVLWAGRHTVVRYQPGTWVFDDTQGAFRLVHKNGKTWYSTSGDPAHMVEWDGIFAAIADLRWFFGKAELHAMDREKDTQAAGHWLRADMGVASASLMADPRSGELRLVEVRRAGEDEFLSFGLPGVLRPGAASSVAPTQSVFRVEYLRVDVPFEDGWSELRVPAKPPLPSIFCDNYPIRKGCPDTSRPRKRPLPVHEEWDHLWFDPTTGYDRDLLVNKICHTEGTLVQPMDVRLEPRANGTPWRDAQEAVGQGCQFTLSIEAVFRAQLGPGTRVCLRQGRLATTIGGSGPRQHTDLDVPPECHAFAAPDGMKRVPPGTPKENHQRVVADLRLPVEPGTDLAQLRAQWAGELLIECLDGIGGYAKIRSGLEAKLQWSCESP